METQFIKCKYKGNEPDLCLCSAEQLILFTEKKGSSVKCFFWLDHLYVRDDLSE